MRLVLVEWVDSASCSGWHSLGKDDCISNCISVGVLCQESDKQVILALNKSDSGYVGDTMSIPKVSIKRIRYLKVA